MNVSRMLSAVPEMPGRLHHAASMLSMGGLKTNSTLARRKSQLKLKQRRPKETIAVLPKAGEVRTLPRARNTMSLSNNQQ